MVNSSNYAYQNTSKLFIPNNSKLVSKLHKVKKINLLDLLRNSIKPLKLIKILTQQRRYIKDIQNGLNNISPKTLAYFPGLSNLDFYNTEAHFWSRLKGHFRFKSLILTLNHYDFSISEFTKSLMNQEPLKRILCKVVWKSFNFGFLKHLIIKANESTEEFVRIFLLKLNMNPLLFSSLKTFQVQTERTIPLPRELYKFVTSLSTKETSFKSNKISLIDFQNLVQLELKLQEDDLDQLKHLGLFKKLKKLTLRLCINYKKNMELFLKNFTLPNNVEDVALDMENVILKNILSKTGLSDFGNIKSFIRQFKNKHTMKRFVLTVEDETRACQVVRGLIVPILELINTLETFYYRNSHSGRTGKIYFGHGFSRYTPAPVINSLDLEMLSTALENSKASLKQIYITDVQVEIDGFSHLLSFLSEDKKKSRYLYIENLKVPDNQSFHTFLQLLLKVSSEITLDVKANIESIAPKDVKTTLCAFLNENNCLKQNVSLRLVNMSKKMKAPDERSLSSVAVKKKLFKKMYVETKKGAVALDI